MILIIDKDKKYAETVRDIFYYMGILSCTAEPSRAFSEISPLYRAVLMLHADSLPDTKSYVTKLRQYAAKIPIYALDSGKTSKEILDIFDGVFDEDISSAELICKMAQYTETRGFGTVGEYQLAGIDADCNRSDVRHFGKKVPFTKTETMILRFLMRSYPSPKPASDILKYVYRTGRIPEVSGIRTHISVMNKKFLEHRGKRLIFSVPEMGYLLMTPESKLNFGII